MLTSNNTNSLI